MVIDQYPLQPLLDHLADHHITSERQIATHLNISRRTVRHHLHTRTLTWTEADTYACHLGHHPYELWPTWLDDQDDQEATNAA